MNEETLKILAEILSDNVGQRLTVALANGILNTFNNALSPARESDQEPKDQQ